MKRPRSAADHLDQALDAAISGDSSALAAHDAETAQTWQLLTEWAALGGLEALPAAPTLLDENVAHPHERPVIMPYAMPAPPPGYVAPPSGQPARRRPLSLAWSALAWLLIVAIGGGAIWGLWPLLNDREPHPTPLTAFQPDLTDATPGDSATVNWGGDAGHPWILGDGLPNTLGPEVLPLFREGSAEVTSPGLIIGDMFVYTVQLLEVDPPGALPYRTFAVDLSTRTLAWIAEAPLVGQFASDGKVIAGFVPVVYGRDAHVVYGQDAQPTDASPVLLDAATGKIHNAMLSMDAGLMFVSQNNTVTVHDGVAYYANLVGSVLAVDLATEEVLWSRGASLMSGYDNAPALADRGVYANLVVTDDGVFAMSASFTVTRLDAGTGEETGRFNLVDDHLMRFESATLQAVGNKLVITAHTSQPGMGESWVFVYGTESLGFFTKARFDRLQSNLVVTLKWIYAVGSMDSEEQRQLFRINPVTGEVTSFETDIPINFNDGDQMGLSLTGTMIMASGPQTSYALIDADSGMPLQNGTIASSSYLVASAPPLLWGDDVVFLDTNGGVHMLTDNAPDGPDQT